MPPIRQEFDNLQPNEPDEVISDNRQQAYQTAMCITTLIFDDIVEPYMPDQVRGQFGAKQGILKNLLVVSKSASRQGGQRDWQIVNADKIAHWLSCQNHMMPEIVEDTDNGLPSEDYKASYNLASTVMLAKELTHRHKWYLEVYNRVNNAFEALSKFVHMDMGDVEARMEILQRQYNDEGGLDEAGYEGVD
ncbi:hypothetical protein AMTR_s00121p00083050 [Amborella trichopoda]|uniref:Uncharacterized protein n=1 Tax=Amborella trichopoda TaxID=13333 RepID=W1NNW9_AMBTC|nr:hypothetical protein AMTR_s00121p00083050 [Amborella trichopoda]